MLWSKMFAQKRVNIVFTNMGNVLENFLIFRQVRNLQSIWSNSWCHNTLNNLRTTECIFMKFGIGVCYKIYKAIRTLLMG